MEKINLKEYSKMIGAAISYGKLTQDEKFSLSLRRGNSEIYYNGNYVYFKDTNWEELPEFKKDLVELYLSILTKLDVLKGEFPNSRIKTKSFKENVLDKFVEVETLAPDPYTYNHVIEIKPIEEKLLKALIVFNDGLEKHIKQSSKKQNDNQNTIDILSK